MDTVFVVMRWNELGSDCWIFDSAEKACEHYKTLAEHLRELHEKVFDRDEIVVYDIPGFFVRQCQIHKKSKKTGQLSLLDKVTLTEETIF